jgi:hypothetical protein
MNRIGLTVTLAALCLAPVLAHSAQIVEPAVPKGLQPEGTVEPSGELQAPVAPRLEMNERRSQHDADARHCLELPTNAQVHRCAERYRTHIARVRAAQAKVASAALKGTETKGSAAAAKSAEIEKPADSGKGTFTIKPMDTTKSAAAAPPPDSARSTSTPKTSDVIKPAAPAKAPEAPKSVK